MKIKRIWIGLMIALLIFGNAYWIFESRKLDYDIIIGVPVESSTDGSKAIDFSRSRPLTQRSEMDAVLFSFMNADAMEGEKDLDDLPDVVVSINIPKENIEYYRVNVWMDDQTIVFQKEGEKQYKIIENIYYVQKLKEVIQNQLYLYQ